MNLVVSPRLRLGHVYGSYALVRGCPHVQVCFNTSFESEKVKVRENIDFQSAKNAYICTCMRINHTKNNLQYIISTKPNAVADSFSVRPNAILCGPKLLVIWKC